MRVLHIHSGNLYGGVESLLLTLNRSRAKCRDMQSVYALAFEGRLAAELRREGGVVAILGETRVRSPLSMIRARRRLRAVLSEGYDVAICHMPWAHALFGGCVRRAGVPLAFWMHGEASGHWLERWASSIQPQVILCNSSFVASSLQRIFSRGTVEVFAIPIDVSKRPISSEAYAAVRNQTETSLESIVIVLASRLEPLKGHSVLLEALANLRTLPNWTCWIAGGSQRREEDDYLALLRNYSLSRGISERLRFLGHQSQVDLLLRASNIYCQPNIAGEGFGLSIAEACAAELPVISTNIGAVPEIVDSDSSILVKPNDPVALSNAIRFLLDNPEQRKRMGVRAGQRIRSLCDPTRQITGLWRILETISLKKG